MSLVQYQNAAPEQHRSGEPYKQLGDAESAFYASLVTASPEKPFIYHNHEADDAQYAKGFAASFLTSTQLSKLTLKDGAKPLLSDRWFGNVAVLPVQERDFTEASLAERPTIKSRLAQIENEGLLQVWSVSDRPSAARDVLTGVDSTNPAFLSGHGHFVAVHEVKRKVSLSEESTDDRPQYYITVHSDSGAVGHALNVRLMEMAHERATLSGFLNSREYRAANEFSRSNALRLVASVAELLGLDRNSRVPDPKWTRPADDPHAAPPDVCNSDKAILASYNALSYHPSDANRIVYYANSTPIRQGMKAVPVLRNPHAGIYLLELDPNFDYASLRKRSISTSTPQENPLMALPIGLGRRVDSAKFKAMEAAQLNARVSSINPESGVFSWSGQSSELPYANWRLAAYRDDTTESKARVRRLVGEGTTIVALKPVAVYLPAK